jgi:AbrB family looped-hinge helix DNA binding protein
MKTTARQDEWIRVLGKGMITIPKKWREELDIEEGAIIKARKVNQQVIIEPTNKPAPVPYRVYSRDELGEFLQDDET